MMDVVGSPDGHEEDPARRYHPTKVRDLAEGEVAQIRQYVDANVEVEVT